jgi:hypothetical protein
MDCHSIPQNKVSCMEDDVSLFRLYLMRAVYLMMFLFLASTKWPLLFHHNPWTLMSGVAFVLLSALGLMAGWAIRYPLKMLPILIFEWVWKTTWVVAIGLPLWRAGKMDPDFAETLKATFPGIVLVPLVIPWPYFWRNYMKAPGDRWTPRVREA